MDCFNRSCGSISEVSNECTSDDATAWDNCTGRIKTKPEPKPKLQLTWRDVFYPHKNYGWIGTMYDRAKEVGYPYFCWNDRIYHTENGNTGLTVKDVT